MYVNLKIDTIDVIYIYNKKYTVKVYEISKWIFHKNLFLKLWNVVKKNKMLFKIIINLNLLNSYSFWVLLH
jgi:hypothetical protein